LVNKKRGGGLSPKTAAVLPLLLLAVPAAAQQPLTLDYLLEQAARQPEVQNGQINIEQAQLGIPASRLIPATEVFAGYGQYNTTEWDYQFSVTQPFQPFGLNKRQREAAEAQLAFAKSDQSLREQRLWLRVQQAWQDWLLASRQLQLRERQAELFAALAERAGLQLRSGEADRLEHTLAVQKLTNARNRERQARLREQTAFQRLRQLAFRPQATRPPDSLQRLPAAPTSEGAALQTQLAPLQQEQQLAERRAAVAEQRLQPGFSIGYFQQSIQPEWVLQGVQVGWSIPLFQKHQRARIEQAQLETAKTANQLRGQRERLEQELALARQQLALLQQQLDTQGNDLLSQASRLRELAKQQLSAGEADYFQFAQSLQAALENELQYAELIARHNRAALYLQFLTR